MSNEKGYFAIAMTLILVVTIFAGCTTLGKQKGPKLLEQEPISVLVYADKNSIAEKVALYLADNTNLIISPSSDVQILQEQNIIDFSVVILIPLHAGKSHFPVNVLHSLRNFAQNGGGIIGMHDILFQQSQTMYEIFGGTAGVFPTDGMSSKLVITKHSFSPITEGIPERFSLVGEHPIITKYNSNVNRLLDMSYEAADGEIKTYCAGWSHKYGDGIAFFLAPGEVEETRYNPYITQMMNNFIVWTAQNKKR